MLLADPYARKKSRTPSKNRVWNFFDPSKSFTGDLSSKTQCSQWEKPETTTTTASEHSYFSLYEAYGTRPYEWGSDPDRQKANTKEEESDLGLLNEGMRYRDLETGTFLNRDPISYSDGPNVYCYVHCNPVTKFDALGLAPDLVGVSSSGLGIYTSDIDGHCKNYDGTYSEHALPDSWEMHASTGYENGDSGPRGSIDLSVDGFSLDLNLKGDIYGVKDGGTDVGVGHGEFSVNVGGNADTLSASASVNAKVAFAEVTQTTQVGPFATEFTTTLFAGEAGLGANVSATEYELGGQATALGTVINWELAVDTDVTPTVVGNFGAAAGVSAAASVSPAGLEVSKAKAYEVIGGGFEVKQEPIVVPETTSTDMNK